MFSRRSSTDSWASSTSATSTDSAASAESHYDLLEPVSSRLPQELSSLSSVSSSSSSSTQCNAEQTSWVSPPSPRLRTVTEDRVADRPSFSLSQQYTAASKVPVCPKHNIRHNPCLALPEREKRSGSFGSISSTSSKRSLKVSSGSSMSAFRISLTRLLQIVLPSQGHVASLSDRTLRRAFAELVES